MKSWLRLLRKYLFLFMVGGFVYVLIEILGRGRSHFSMFVLGGICFIFLGLLNEVFSWETPLLLQMLAGSVTITVLEFITGCYVNLYLGLNVWDYSKLPWNYLGQICLLYSVFWFFLSAVGIILDDFLRYKFFGEDKPKYKLFV